MTFRLFIGAALLVGLTAPAAAQSVQQDVRCVLLSGMFAKGAKEERGKQLARVTGAFYLGRLNGRADTKAITEAMRTQRKTIDAKTAGDQMQACATKLGEAEKAINAAGKALGGEK